VPLDGFKMQTAGAMCVTHTMSLEQCALSGLSMLAGVLCTCACRRVLRQDIWDDWLALRAQTGIESPVRRVCWCPGQAGLSGRWVP